MDYKKRKYAMLRYRRQAEAADHLLIQLAHTEVSKYRLAQLSPFFAEAWERAEPLRAAITALRYRPVKVKAQFFQQAAQMNVSDLGSRPYTEETIVKAVFNEVDLGRLLVRFQASAKRNRPAKSSR